MKKADANTVEVAQAVDHRIQELRPTLPVGVELGVVEDQANHVLPALAGVRNAALEAAVFVLLIIFFLALFIPFLLVFALTSLLFRAIA